ASESGSAPRQIQGGQWAGGVKVQTGPLSGLQSAGGVGPEPGTISQPLGTGQLAPAPATPPKLTRTPSKPTPTESAPMATPSSTVEHGVVAGRSMVGSAKMSAMERYVSVNADVSQIPISGLTSSMSSTPNRPARKDRSKRSFSNDIFA